MSVQLEEATEKLRGKLLEGQFPPGKKLREISVAESLGVSRTIARLAMSALEHEGLLTREKNRGSATRAFTVDEIVDAIEVRGELEAMAARIVAERGLPDGAKQLLQHAIDWAEMLLASGVETEEDRSRWTSMNLVFHQTLVKASGNRAIEAAISQMLPLPLVSPRSIIFDLSNSDVNYRQLERSHNDHVAIADAIKAGQGHRAESLVREHAFRSAQNKRQNLSDPLALQHARKLPGGMLIVPDKPNRRGKKR